MAVLTEITVRDKKNYARLTSLPSRMANHRAGDMVSMPGIFSDGIHDVKPGHLYELANVGSDRRAFSVACSIDVIAVVMLHVPFLRGTDAPIAPRVSMSIRAANKDKGVIACLNGFRSIHSCHSAIISRICAVITDTELCSARTSASGSTLLMEAILGWWKSHSAVVTLFLLELVLA